MLGLFVNVCFAVESGKEQDERDFCMFKMRSVRYFNL